jgi:transcription-repair coupling factor (superfamily II helicase)
MTAVKLDEIMNHFYDGKYNVLISTTIIESGLDIPNANTIIIDRSHMFGLAQLYQVRGRVGRGKEQAYAYFTAPRDMRLSPIAQRRMEVMQSVDYLGAGFSIASHDMDIRGYGNLVGDEQSGHIKEVGIELYQQMLEEAVLGLKANQEQEISDKWSPVLNLGVAVQIPESYIPDSSLRLTFYRRIASVVEDEELESLHLEMLDRFGELPESVLHLFEIIKLKQLAIHANIEKMDLGDKGLLLMFRNSKPVSFEKVIDLVTKNAGTVKLRADNKLFFTMLPKEHDALIIAITKLLKELI